MNTYVLDASLAIAVMLKENFKATAFVKKIQKEINQGKSKIIAPQFLLLEVANALRFRIPKKEESQKVLKDFSKIPISFQEFNASQIAEIQNFAYEFNTTVYDTTYHYLAKILDGTFVTCDRAYFQKSKSWGNIKIL